MKTPPIAQPNLLIPEWPHISLDQALPVLKQGECHIWLVKLSLDAEHKETALSFLNTVQRNRYQRRTNTESRERYLAGRYYLYRLLAHYAELAIDQIELGYSRLDKPHLLNNPNKVSFNYTDTQGYGVFAFSQGHPLGIDIESLERQLDFNKIAAARFSSSELDYVYQEKQRQRERMLTIWTRKEAWGKAHALGINFNMSTLDTLENNGILHAQNDQPWVFQQIQLPFQLIGCLVHQGDQALTLKTFQITR